MEVSRFPYAFEVCCFSFCADVFMFSSFLFFFILVECKETNQFAAIQYRWLFNCTGVHSSLYTVNCTHVLQQPGMNSLSYVLVQGWHTLPSWLNVRKQTSSQLFSAGGCSTVQVYTVDCTHVLEQPGMNIFSYVLVQGWKFSSTLKTNASSTESVVAISPCFLKKANKRWFSGLHRFERKR